MQIATRTELSQEANPPVTLSHAVQLRQEGMVDHLQYLPLCSSPAFFVPTLQFLLIHYLCGHHTSLFASAFQLSQVDAADVARSESLYEAQIRDGEGVSRGVGSETTDRGEERIDSVGVGFGERARGGGAGGGCSGDGRGA